MPSDPLTSTEIITMTQMFIFNFNLSEALKLFDTIVNPLYLGDMELSHVPQKMEPEPPIDATSISLPELQGAGTFFSMTDVKMADQMQKLLARVTELEKSRDQAREELLNARSEITSLTTTIEGLRGSIKELTTLTDYLENEQHQTDRDVRKLNETIFPISLEEPAFAPVQETLDEMQLEISEIDDQIGFHENTLRALTTSLENIVNLVTKHKETLDAQGDDLNELKLTVAEDVQGDIGKSSARPVRKCRKKIPQE